ncbi:hypothetical protein CPLU01_12384 [Colletotrichum plurivorum]|uniref:Uncharacterized protein n=1 Tax=Colletotrichum plurivorum TaxID=2175906 RepID=A0A8H6K017_9PEZI|nr:hypothetical protein CPLU01_12384 [Colletotrichum plurivorum]
MQAADIPADISPLVHHAARKKKERKTADPPREPSIAPRSWKPSGAEHSHSSWQHSPPQAACQVDEAKDGADAAADTAADTAANSFVLSLGRRPYSPVYSPPTPSRRRAPVTRDPKRRSSTPSGTVPPHPAQQREPTFAGREREHSDKGTRFAWFAAEDRI